MKATRTLLYFFFLMMAAPTLWAQDDDAPVRVEFGANAEVFQVVPCGEAGVLMFYESVKQIENQTKAWIFIFYDTYLNPVWSKEIPVYNDFGYAKSYVSDGRIYLTWLKNTKPRRDEYNLQLVSIHLAGGTYNSQSIFVPEKAELINFEVHENTFMAGFNYPKEEALLLIRDLTAGTDNAVLFTENPSFIENLIYNPFSNQVLLAINIYSSRKTSTLYLNSYNLSGERLESAQLTPAQSSVKLMNAQIHIAAAREWYILGSFNHLNGSLSRSDEDKLGEPSEGFYIAEIKNQDQQFLRLHKLIDFKNITTILNNEELREVENLVNKEKKKGRSQSLNYQFLMHDLQQHGGNFVMLAEAYYPEYHQVTTMSYDFYGRPMPYYYTVFDGYRYFNAFAAGLDMEGNLLWSNGIKIWDMRSMQLLRRVEASSDGQQMVIFYNDNGRIVSKIIDGYQDIGEVERTRLATKNLGDVQLEASNGMTAHWYDNYYLAWGYQTLRNSEVAGGSKRSIFYINKLIFN
ncbi:MAG: hypothetical protein EOM83_14510 [Clostridia bacterium]|nr:hypothetical protein [Clostridia bacterium]